MDKIKNMNKKVLKKIVASDSQNLLRAEKESWLAYQIKKLFCKLTN